MAEWIFPLLARTCLPLRLRGLPRKIGHPPPGFGNHQAGGGYVPGTKLHFPKPVEPPRRNIAKIEGGGTAAAHALSAEGEIAKVVKIVDFGFPQIVRKTRGRKKAAGKASL